MFTDTILALQVLLLLMTLFVWWTARKDVLNLIEKQQTPTLAKIEKVRSSVEELLGSLDEKIVEADKRAADITSPAAVSIPPKRQSSTKFSRQPETVTPPVQVAQESETASDAVATPTDSSYETVYALANNGVSPDEIARMTGLGSAEVEMVISLRPKP